jgi:hypothetical protein
MNEWGSELKKKLLTEQVKLIREVNWHEKLESDWANYLYMALQSFVVPWRLLSFLILYTLSVELLGRGIISSQGLHLTQTQNKRT